jgi:hypothetical protein
MIRKIRDVRCAGPDGPRASRPGTGRSWRLRSRFGSGTRKRRGLSRSASRQARTWHPAAARPTFASGQAGLVPRLAAPSTRRSSATQPSTNRPAAPRPAPDGLRADTERRSFPTAFGWPLARGRRRLSGPARQRARPRWRGPTGTASAPVRAARHTVPAMAGGAPWQRPCPQAIAGAKRGSRTRRFRPLSRTRKEINARASALPAPMARALRPIMPPRGYFRARRSRAPRKTPSSRRFRVPKKLETNRRRAAIRFCRQQQFFCA